MLVCWGNFALAIESSILMDGLPRVETMIYEFVYQLLLLCLKAFQLVNISGIGVCRVCLVGIG
jgi:hypothetical protein